MLVWTKTMSSARFIVRTRSLLTPIGTAAYQAFSSPRRFRAVRVGTAVRGRGTVVCAIAEVASGASATPASVRARAWRRVIGPILSIRSVREDAQTKPIAPGNDSPFILPDTLGL